MNLNIFFGELFTIVGFFFLISSIPEITGFVLIEDPYEQYTGFLTVLFILVGLGLLFLGVVQENKKPKKRGKIILRELLNGEDYPL